MQSQQHSEIKKNKTRIDHNKTTQLLNLKVMPTAHVIVIQLIIVTYHATE